MIPQQEYTLNVHLNKYTDNCEKNGQNLPTLVVYLRRALSPIERPAPTVSPSRAGAGGIGSPALPASAKWWYQVTPPRQS